jgi:hypothetical protein
MAVLPVMVVVALYIVTTIPLLALLLAVHRLRSDYTRLFQAALVLQIVPLGVLFFPLGFVGLALLVLATGLTVRRNRRFSAMRLENPAVARRWALVHLANAWALGFAVLQKGVVYLFLEVVGHRGLGFATRGLLPLAGLVALTLAGVTLRAFVATPALRVRPVDPAA